MSTSIQKALIVLTSTDSLGKSDAPTGFWLSELTHPYYAMADRGIEVDIASIKGGKAPVDPRSENESDQANERFMDTPRLVQMLNNTPALADIDISNYQAVLFAGGHGTMWDFPDSPAVQDKAVALYEAGGTLAAVCHGPSALVNLKLSNGDYLVKDKKVAAFTNKEEAAVELDKAVPFLLQDKLSERGARFVEEAPWGVNVVVDENLITGQNPQSAAAVGKAVCEALLLEHEAEA